MIDFSSLVIDTKNEAEGKWVQYPEWKGARFKVCPLQLPAYQTELALAQQELAKEYDGKEIPTDKVELLMGKMYAKHLLKDWYGFTTKYSADLGTDICTKPEYRHLLNAAFWCINKASRADAKFIEDETKNSVEPSASL